VSNPVHSALFWETSFELTSWRTPEGEKKPKGELIDKEGNCGMIHERKKAQGGFSRKTLAEVGKKKWTVGDLEKV